MSKRRINILLTAIVVFCAANILVLAIWFGNDVIITALSSFALTGIVVATLIFLKNQRRM